MQVNLGSTAQAHLVAIRRTMNEAYAAAYDGSFAIGAPRRIVAVPAGGLVALNSAVRRRRTSASSMSMSRSTS